MCSLFPSCPAQPCTVSVCVRRHVVPQEGLGSSLFKAFYRLAAEAEVPDMDTEAPVASPTHTSGVLTAFTDLDYWTLLITGRWWRGAYWQDRILAMM